MRAGAAMGEFDLIARYFRQPAQALHTPAVLAGIGDDCALLQPAAGAQLLVSSDTLVAGRHFFADTDAARLGHKALAVNLSDLAACAATPLGFTLALTLPAVDEAWLQAFAQGLLALAQQCDCPLVGGDTTRGPLSITITAFGQVPPGQALLRSGARVGHDVYVSGAIGEARAALQLLQGHWQCGNAALRAHLLQRLEAPSPRLELARHLRGVASSAMDLSDGLYGDAQHLLAASGVGACIRGASLLETAPRLWAAPELAAWPEAQRIAFALAGGDDYELLFTAHPGFRSYLSELGQELGMGVQRIGQITPRPEAGPALQVLDGQGQPMAVTAASFDHFAGSP